MAKKPKPQAARAVTRKKGPSTPTRGKGSPGTRAGRGSRTERGSGTKVAQSRTPGISTGPVVVNPNVLPRIADPIQSFFDTSRAGRAVVRPHDLLAVRIELHNVSIDPGTPPRMRKSGTGAAHLIVHFPPQAITEETFFETRPAGTQNPPEDLPDGIERPPEPGGSEPLTGPPVRARISGESRLVFVVPDDFAADYTLEGLLTAIEQLELAVTANARPPATPRPTPTLADLFAGDLTTLSRAQRSALSSFAARTLRIAAVQGDAATLQLRQAIGGPGLRAIAQTAVSAVDVIVDPTLPLPRPGPQPAAPTSHQTSIELPWRLILSPHRAERWRHAKTPVTSPAGRTELWHTRLVAPKSDGSLIEPPRPDTQRSLRAVWALTGEHSPQPMSGDFPVGNLPGPNLLPFRMPLDDFDRCQIVHLSSNFAQTGYTPDAIGANLLMLSTLGGWLDSRGAWNPPPGMSVEEWVHRAAMARDHYVRVVYKGYLYPFGHRVALVKVSERKFHNGARDGNGQVTIEQKSGNTAYLRQRLFIVVRERERRYGDTNLHNTAGTVFYHFQLPFSTIRLITTVTPNLDQPGSEPSRIQPSGTSQQMFWPCVNGQPFRFQCAATDLDGRTVKFDLPMIFIENTLLPNITAAEDACKQAQEAWQDLSRGDRRTADFKQQRVALAQSTKPGDTSVQTDEITFDAEVEKGNATLRAYAEHNKLTRPPFYPKVHEARVRIAALAQLTGSTKTNRIAWNAHYKQHGFTDNEGQVFVDVVSETNMAKLDFSTQGDRSGGFVQPNLKPSAMSRITGPVTGNVGDFIDGHMDGADAFPASLSDLPLPLLFGCIPLGDVIEEVANLGQKPEQIPKFASEASTQVESFINGLVRLFDFVSRLSDQPGRLAEAAIAASANTLQDLLDQSQAYAAPLVANVQTRINQLVTALNGVTTQVHALVDVEITAAPALPGLAAAIAAAQTASANLRTAANAQVGGVSLPSGLRQSVLQAATHVDTFVGDVGTITTLVTQGKALYTALDAIVGHPEQLGDLLSDPDELGARLTAVEAAIAPLRLTIAGFRLLEGAPRKAVLDAIDAVLQVVAAAGQLTELLAMLTGDELTIRFDWNPPIANWALPGADPNTDALFRANDKRGFLVAVEAKVKKNGESAPKISVVCSLKSFDLVLIAPASFIELNFEKIEFRVDSGAKMDVDVVLTDIKFVGPLSFVETLRDLIPLDGFSDPPFLDITPQGIDAGFSLALPNVSIGVFNLSNLSLGAGFTVPFIGQPVSVRFNFCTREQPFNLTVTLFGGGGFFGITLDPHGIQILEASFEFGASISIDFGVASGGVYVMAGVYFRMEQDACSLTGYFRLGGHVDVLGLITASIELYLELRYEFESGKCVGKATLTIEIEVFVFSGSVSITCERKFAGSNGDPTFRDLMGAAPALSLDDELAQIDDDTVYPWRDYCEAFAA